MPSPVVSPYLLIHPDDFVHPAEGETVTVGGADFTLLAGKSDGQVALGVILANLPGGFAGIGRHVHRQTTELCHVLRGTLAFTSGAETGIARAGSMLLLPAGTAHSLWNPTPEPVRYLSIFSPAGAEQLIRGLADAGPSHRLTQPLFAAAGRRYDHFPVDGQASAHDVSTAADELPEQSSRTVRPSDVTQD
jgi:quercetin dioxygenase-like cupin family protein